MGLTSRAAWAGFKVSDGGVGVNNIFSARLVF